MPKVGKSELVNSDSMSRLKSTIYIWRVVRLELTELVAIATLVMPLEENYSRRIVCSPTDFDDNACGNGVGSGEMT